MILTGTKTACVSTRTIKVSLYAFTTLDISAVLSHYGWTFTPFKPNPSLARHRKPNRSCVCEETLRLQHSDRRVEICQSAGLFSPSSFRQIRGLILFIGWGSHETDNRTLISSVGTHRTVSPQVKASILVGGQVVLGKFCLRSNLEYRKHSCRRDLGDTSL